MFLFVLNKLCTKIEKTQAINQFNRASSVTNSCDFLALYEVISISHGGKFIWHQVYHTFYHD